MNKLTLSLTYHKQPIHIEVHVFEGTLHELVLVGAGDLPLVGQQEYVVSDGLILLHADEPVLVLVHEIEDVLRILLGRVAGEGQDDQHELPEVDVPGPLWVEHCEDVARELVNVWEGRER